jgi:hypothetical protein
MRKHENRTLMVERRERHESKSGWRRKKERREQI